MKLYTQNYHININIQYSMILLKSIPSKQFLHIDFFFVMLQNVSLSKISKFIISALVVEADWQLCGVKFTIKIFPSSISIECLLMPHEIISDEL